MKPSKEQWETIISRWSNITECGEKRLLCYLLADAVKQEIDSWHTPGDVFRSPFFSLGRFDRYMKLLGIEPNYVKKEMQRWTPA